ncbi:MAG: AI-2E family transporter [Desulfosalsimonadaceae bacterium]
MEAQGGLPQALRIMLAIACFVVIIAGMRSAAGLLVPFLLSVFIAIICTPLLFWLQNRGIPKLPAIALIVVFLVVIGYWLVIFIGASVADFTTSLPGYQKRLLEESAALIQWFQHRGVNLSERMVHEYMDPSVAMQMAARMLSGLSAALTNAFLIFLTVFFILLEVSGMSDKYRAALKHPEKSLAGIKQFAKSVNRYLALKTIFSMITGVAIAAWLSFLEVDYAVLWGLAAFLLNYVPNIGSIIAAIPAVLMALIQLGPWSAIFAGAGYLAVNILIGSLLEPRFMGRGLGLSTLVVFLSLAFWGWVLGPVGMLLSVPLTMIFKIAMESHEETRWLAVMLGNETNPPARSQASSE